MHVGQPQVATATCPLDAGRREAPLGEKPQQGVEADGDDVTTVAQRGDAGHGVHPPVETESGRVEEQPEVEDRQVGEGEQTCQEAGVSGRGVVGGGKLGQARLEADGQEDDGSGPQDEHAAPLFL